MLIEFRSTDVVGTIVAFVGLASLFVGMVFIDHGDFKQTLIIVAIVLSIAALAILLVPTLGGRNN